MTSESAHPVQLRQLTAMADFKLGSLLVSPSRRQLQGPDGSHGLQPQVMSVFVCLAQRLDTVVTRRMLFEACWGNAPVGDDSLNQALRAIREALRRAGAGEVSIETIPRTGYRLTLGSQPHSPAGEKDALVDAAYDCWRAGLPEADAKQIDALELRLGQSGGSARDWGILALLLRKAAEYGTAAQCAAFVARCERAARRALATEPREPNALVALAGVVPLFGNWTDTRNRLSGILASHEDHIPGRHDLAVLEMATGRPSVAAPIVERLLSEDGLAASFHYKRIYHLWTLGHVNGAEQAAVRALQLWPRHPAIWSARYWILLFTGRAEQAVSFVDEVESRPFMPAPAAEFLKVTALAVAESQAGRLSSDAFDRHVAQCLDNAALGPARAVSALMSLCALQATDSAFAVARGYYLGAGPATVPVRPGPADPAITDQYRRITQPLFIPATQPMRDDGRFMQLCADIGLADHWDRFGITPDFLQG